MKETWGGSGGLARSVQDWEDFAEQSPQTDNANDYVQAHGLHVPLFEFLFSPISLDPVIAERALNKVVIAEAGTMGRVQSVNNVQPMAR